MRLYAKLVVLSFALLFLFTIFAPFAPRASAAFNLFQDSCRNTQDNQAAYNSPACQDIRNKGKENPITGPRGIIQTAANIVALVAGVGAVIIILLSAYTFVTAGGSIGGQRAGDSPTRAKNARTTLTYAVVGLVVVALAWSIVSFITHRIIQT